MRFVEAVEDRERLEEHRTLAPRPGLGDRVSAEIQGERVLEAGGPVGHIGRGEDPGVQAAVGMAMRGADEIGDAARDPTGAPFPPGGGDPLLSGGFSVPGRDELSEHLRVLRVADERSGLGGLPVLQPQVRGARPVGPEQRARAVDRLSDAGEHGMSPLGVVDREGEDLGELPGAVLLEEQEPGVDRTGHGGGQRPGTGHRVEPFGPEVLDRRPGRSGPLAHEDDRTARLLSSDEHPGHVAAGPVEVRLDDVEDEGPDDGRVEGIAAELEHRLGGAGRQPVRRGCHPEGAFESRAGRGGLAAEGHVSLR